MDKNKALFFKNFEYLLQEHRDKFACCVEGYIYLGYDEVGVFKKATKIHGDVPMYIAKITDQKEMINLYPKFVR